VNFEQIYETGHVGHMSLDLLALQNIRKLKT
jgi:hypothetical protein